jgi:drug/metabolite transporter (DMT)-like permease
VIDTGTTLAVLGAALIHAIWNAAIKRAADPLFESALMHAWLLPLALTALIWAEPPEAFTLGCALASALVHCVYFHALAAAYRQVDLSITYPILRGSAPALTAIGAVLLMGEHPSTQGWLGIVMICGGVITMGVLAARSSGPGRLTDSRELSPLTRAIGWALFTALTIVAYTLIDSAGVRSAPQAWVYVAWLTVLQGPVVCAVILVRERGRFVHYARQRRMTPLFTGLASMGAYGIALWAMTRAPVAAVAALRETSILFALLIARYMLAERPGLPRWSAALVIAAGVMVLRAG